MKLLKKLLVVFLALCLTFALVACGQKGDLRERDESSSKGDPMTAEADDYTAPSTVGGDWAGSSAIVAKLDGARTGKEIAEYGGKPSAGGEGVTLDASDGDFEPSFDGDVIITDPEEMPKDLDDPEKFEIDPRAGLITASAWNENINYDYWLSLFADKQSEEDNGKFLDFLKNNSWGFDSTKRVKVTVTCGEEPVSGASVTAFDDEGKERFLAKTGADGVAYLFPEVKSGTLRVTSGENTADVAFDGVNVAVEVQLGAAAEKQNRIKLMFVVDVTGSMGDELDYLKAELADVVNRVALSDPETQIDLALLFYRDNGDAEKFAYYDFVNVNDEAGLALQQKNIGAQRVDGGGDPPEAVDEALEMAMAQAWGDDTSTKIIFHILDAPPHYNGEDGTDDDHEGRYEAAVRSAAAMGIRICPITCSGADLLCEYVVREAAIYTGGTFIFVTDHSGIGGEHLDPGIPDAVVENLNDLMVRLVKGYHTGVFEEPVEWKATAEDEYKQ